MGQNFEKKMKFSKIKFLWIKKKDLTCEMIVPHACKCRDIEYELYILSMISVSALRLCLRDTVLYLTCHLNCVDG